LATRMVNANASKRWLIEETIIFNC
jgi:hypothetical protein